MSLAHALFMHRNPLEMVFLGLQYFLDSSVFNLRFMAGIFTLLSRGRKPQVMGICIFFRSDWCSHASSLFWVEDRKEGQQFSCRFLLEPPSKSLLLDDLMVMLMDQPVLMSKRMITSAPSIIQQKKLAAVPANLGKILVSYFTIMILLQFLAQEQWRFQLVFMQWLMCPCLGS